MKLLAVDPSRLSAATVPRHRSGITGQYGSAHRDRASEGQFGRGSGQQKARRGGRAGSQVDVLTLLYELRISPEKGVISTLNRTYIAQRFCRPVCAFIGRCDHAAVTELPALRAR